MNTGYIAITFFDHDTVATAWGRCCKDSVICIHSDLDQLLQQVRVLPGQELIGICHVCCTQPTDPTAFVPPSAVSNVFFLGRPSELLMEEKTQ